MMNFIKSKSRLQSVSVIGIYLIAICALFIPFKSNPAETQLTYLVWFLPFILLLPLKNKIYPIEIKFLVLTVLIFISSILSYGVQGDIFTHDFRSHWTYLISIGVLAALSSNKISNKYLCSILIITSFLVAYDVTVEMFYGGSRGFNTHGKPIFFGNIALMAGLISFILSFNKENSLLIRGLLMTSSVLGIAGSIWSQTRGGWIFLVLFIVVFSVGYIFNAKNKKKASLYGACSLLFICISMLPFYDAIELRINEAHSNIENYILSKNTNTSVGLRLELWKVSAKQFIENPFIGSARSGFLAIKDEMISKGDITLGAKYFEHAHSDLFWTLGSKGLLGIISLYGFYLFLLRFYYINSKQDEVRLYAFSGLTIVTGYMVFGLTESFFSMKLGIGYFIIINLIIMRLINSHNQNAEKPFILRGGN